MIARLRQARRMRSTVSRDVPIREASSAWLNRSDVLSTPASAGAYGQGEQGPGQLDRVIADIAREVGATVHAYPRPGRAVRHIVLGTSAMTWHAVRGGRHAAVPRPRHRSTRQ